MYALGPNAHDTVSRALRSYYAFDGDEYVEYGIGIAHTESDHIASAVSDVKNVGCHELIFMGNDGDPDQVDLLADAVGL
ncbi:hypothetical protein EF847_00050 [Actinobacteria bacterium YIM 96077]|uniref:LLM class F420-dependent oxidoreductase n=2 Tax=Phytoactinopolyspora halophila TaxID=1981511 RepID=A0A329QTS8_9ACTN|nr:hypothetical protein EF847_00050 [Actinobacteria bacterium YIM 96077]RAW14702.1 hypothetical protein DPM12_10620 [Phytoactinopolyspora halophila]